MPFLTLRLSLDPDDKYEDDESAPVASSYYLLLENGDKLLLENSDDILLESST